MVSFIKWASLALISGASLVSAATFHVDIDYDEYLDIYYYFRDYPDAVKVEADISGLTVTLDSSAFSISDCEVLQSGMIVYSADGGSDNTLISWDQYEVFHLVHDGQEITYSAVNAQSCGPVSVATSSTVTNAVNDIPTRVVSVDDVTDGAYATTALVPSASVVTVTENGVVSSFTTYCPISTLYGHSTVIVTKENKVVTSYTTFCPISEVVLSVKPHTVTKTITSCDNHACIATTSVVESEEVITITRTPQPTTVGSESTTLVHEASGVSTVLSGAVPSGAASSNGSPSGAVPSNGSPSGAVPSNGSPSGAVPSNGSPSGAVPSNGSPSGAVPSNGSPSGAVPSNGSPSNAAPSNTVPASKILTNTVQPSSTKAISTYAGEANHVTFNKLAVGFIAIGAAML